MPLALSFAAFDDWMHPLDRHRHLRQHRALQLRGARAVALRRQDRRLTGRAAPRRCFLDVALGASPGLLLSVPITVCLVVMGKYVPQLEFLEVLLGDEPALEPYQRLYQRLLTSNRDEADVRPRARRCASTRLREVCDIAIVPALRLLEADFARGSLKACAPPRGPRPDPAVGGRAARGDAAHRRARRDVVAGAVDSVRPGRGSGGCHHRQAPRRGPDQAGYQPRAWGGSIGWRRRSRRAPRL